MSEQTTEQKCLLEQDLIDALAGMLDSFGGYVTPECDAAIAALQKRGIDRWSAMARPVPTFDISEDEEFSDPEDAKAHRRLMGLE